MNQNRWLGIPLSLLFGFAVWTALALGTGGRSCTDNFEWWAAWLYYSDETIFLFVLWLPIVFVVAAVAYFGATRIRALRHPIVRLVVVLIVLALVFGLGALLTHNTERCPDF
jgi:hypothetical protein